MIKRIINSSLAPLVLIPASVLYWLVFWIIGQVFNIL